MTEILTQPIPSYVGFGEMLGSVLRRPALKCRIGENVIIKKLDSYYNPAESLTEFLKQRNCLPSVTCPANKENQKGRTKSCKKFSGEDIDDDYKPPVAKIARTNVTRVQANRVETRYFCPSCLCYVDASQRRHDQMVHKPPRYCRVTPKRASSLFHCAPCDKSFLSEKQLNRHQSRVHDQVKVELEEDVPLKSQDDHTNQPQPSSKPKSHLMCYDCNRLIVRKMYIQHLKKHDQEKIKQSSQVFQSFCHEQVKKGRQVNNIDTLREEYKRRRFVYPNTNTEDPRWNNDDAVLQCRHCPGNLYFYWHAFERHMRNLHPYVPSASSKIRSDS